MAANPVTTSTIYMSFGFSTGGRDGSAALPYSRWEEILAEGAGYLTDKTLLIQRGRTRNTIAADIPVFDGESNFIIGSYLDAGVGPVAPNLKRPTTYGSNFDGTAWVADAGLSNAWYITGYAQSRGVSLNDKWLINYATSAEMLLDTEKGMWWDTGTNRIYCNPSLTPNSTIRNVTRDGDSSPYVIAFTNCTNFIIKDNGFERGAQGCLNVGAGCADYLLENNNLMGSGNWTTGGQQCLRIAGVVGGVKQTGVVIRKNTMSQSANNLLEMKDVTAPLVEFNVGSDAGMGLEIWGYVTNGTFRGNRWQRIENKGTGIGHGDGLWMTASSLVPGETGNSTGNTFDGDIYDSAIFAGVTVDLNNGGNTWTRCSFINNGTCFHAVGTQTTDNTINLCLFNKQGTAAFTNAVTGARLVHGKNQYFSSGTTGFKWVVESVQVPAGTETNGQVAFAAFAAVTGDTGQWANYTEVA